MVYKIWQVLASHRKHFNQYKKASARLKKIYFLWTLFFWRPIHHLFKERVFISSISTCWNLEKGMLFTVSHLLHSMTESPRLLHNVANDQGWKTKEASKWGSLCEVKEQSHTAKTSKNHSVLEVASESKTHPHHSMKSISLHRNSQQAHTSSAKLQRVQVRWQ